MKSFHTFQKYRDSNDKIKSKKKYFYTSIYLGEDTKDRKCLILSVKNYWKI